jgi:hypothetical protein
MKDVYFHKNIIKAIGYLTTDDNGDRIIEAYVEKDAPPVIISVDDLLEAMMGLQVQISAEKEL